MKFSQITWLPYHIKKINEFYYKQGKVSEVIDDILYREVTKKTGIMVDVNVCWIKE